MWLNGRNCVVCAVICIGELKLSRDILSWYHKRRETHEIPDIDPNQSRLIFRSSNNASQCRAEMRSHRSVSVKMITFIKWAQINILLLANYSPIRSWSSVTGWKTFHILSANKTAWFLDECTTPIYSVNNKNYQLKNLRWEYILIAGQKIVKAFTGR